MKLTKKHREDFVEAVMADVPKESYATQIEDAIRKLWRAILKREKLGNVDAERLNKESVYVCYFTHDTTKEAVAKIPKGESRWNYTSRSICSLRLHGLTQEEAKKLPDSAEVAELVGKVAVQYNQRAALRKKITAAIASCSTLKQAKEALPEFEKYLPVDPEVAFKNMQMLEARHSYALP